MKKNIQRAATVALLSALAACSSAPLVTPGEGGKVVIPIEVLGQSALPAGSVVKAEQSLIMGAGEQWVGRVVADVGRDSETAYRFFMETYPAQGWTLVSAVRGKTSLIVMTRQDRTATVELSESSAFSAGTLVLTVSPRNAQVSAPRKP